VADVGRQALGDTRRLVGVLRAGDPSDGRTPQPGVAQIDGLLEQVHATGLAASLVTEGQPRPLPAGTELTAYRIVQEATTNTLKHAVGATALAVTLDYGPESLKITVRDNGRPPHGRHPGRDGSRTGGHGLDGMRERAAVYQGNITAGPAEGGWLVLARIPIAPLANPVAPPRPRTAAIQPRPVTL
jgi:signal transduction histidine kinase